MKIITEIYKCDRCAKEFKPSLLKPWAGWRISFHPVRKGSDAWPRCLELELCRECAESLTEWYKSGLAGGGKHI